jgi:hypothetical protein
MNREDLVAWWDESWEKGMWSAPWSKSLEDLTPKEAAWKPSPERHSIWQIVEHMIFWRQYAVDRLGGAEPLSDEEIQRRNFPEPREISDAAWHQTRERFGAAQKRVREAFLNPSYTTENIRNLVPHDHYHFGQIMYVKALIGKKPME